MKARSWNQNKAFSKPVLLTLLLGSLPLLCAAEAAPSALPDSLPPRHYVLQTVRVVADRPAESIGSLRVVEFSGKQGLAALNLFDGLQDISGISNTTGTKDESNLRLRGFRKNEVKVLIDGRPLNSGYFGNIDLHQIAPADIREIRVLKGPGSAVYGSGTMGGVVNIITADPDNSEWLRLALLAKRNNSNRISLSSARRLGDFGYRIHLAREHSEGIALSKSFPGAPFENGGVRDHSRKTQYDLQGRLDYQASPYTQYGFSAGLSAVPEKLIPSSIYAMDYRSYRDMLRSWLTLESESVLSGDLTLSAHAYYDASQDTYEQFNDPGHDDLVLSSDMRGSTIGANPRLEWAPDGINTFTFGVRAENLRNTRRDNSGYLDWTPHWMGTYNAFGQWERRLGGIVSYALSLGVSCYHSDVKRSLNLYAEPSGGIYLNWSPNSESSLSLGRNTAFPTMRQLFSAEHGNPDLEPQSALKAELTHRQSARVWGIGLNQSASLFFNDIRGLIDRAGDIYQNIHRLRSWGVEYSLAALPLAWWETEISCACLFWSGEQGYQITESPRNQAALSQTWLLPADISLNYRLSYTDIRLSQDESNGYHTLPAYWRHDLSATWKYRKHSLSLGLENILDAYYETEYGYPAAGLNFFLRLEAAL